MEVWTKSGCLLYAQTDHLSGEELGSAIEHLYKAGASNVQVLSSVTKKNRPGHVFLIDVRPDLLKAVEQAMLLNLRITGWHRIESDHRHLRTEIKKQSIRFVTSGGSFSMDAAAKYAWGVEFSIRPEHSSCCDLQEQLARHGIQASIHTCSLALESAFRAGTQVFRWEEHYE